MVHEEICGTWWEGGEVMIEPRRGDVFYIKKYDNFGTEMQAGRPAVIVSNDFENKYARHVMVVYLTTQEKKDLPTHCQIVGKQKSTVICEQITSVDKERLGDWVKTVTDAEMKKIDHCLKEALDLKDAEEPAEVPVAEPYVHDDNEVTKLKIERDMFKQLYEDLLGKVVK